MIVGTIGLIILNTGLFMIGIVVWNRMWFSRFGVQIPNKREVREETLGPSDSIEVVQGSLRALIEKFGKIMWEMDTSHWI
jgi:hypothetical protein